MYFDWLIRICKESQMIYFRVKSMSYSRNTESGSRDLILEVCDFNPFLAYLGNFTKNDKRNFLSL